LLAENSAIKEMQPNRGYYILVARQNDTYPPAFRWQIMRRGEPMGVQIGEDGFPTYLAARLAGGRALADFLEQLELEKSRTGRGSSQ
jgi:hypothetical protein